MDLPSLNIAPIIASGFAPRQVRAAAASLLDLVLPPRPLDETSAHGVQSVGLSADSWSRIKFIEAPFCDGCGAPFDYEIGAGARCAACQARSSAFDRARAACLYDDASRDLILKLKHADRTDLAALLSRWLARAAADVLGDTDAIVPVRCTVGVCSSAATIRRRRSPGPWPRPPAFPTGPTRWAAGGAPTARAESPAQAAGAMWPGRSKPPSGGARASPAPGCFWWTTS